MTMRASRPSVMRSIGTIGSRQLRVIRSFAADTTMSQVEVTPLLHLQGFEKPAPSARYRRSLSFDSSSEKFDPIMEMLISSHAHVVPPKSDIDLSMSSFHDMALKQLHLEGDDADLTTPYIPEIHSVRDLISPAIIALRQDLAAARHNAYAFGRGFLEKPLPVYPAAIPEPPIMTEIEIPGYEEFWDAIQELTEINKKNDQIVCVFTASLFHTAQSWNSDCSRLAKQIFYIKQKQHPAGYLLWVRTGTHVEWNDINNPFKRDPRLQIRALPTVMVWNTEKRIAGKRCFDNENLEVIFSD